MLEATAGGGAGHTVPQAARQAVPPPHLQHPLYPQMPYPAPPIQQPQPLQGMPPPPPPPMSVPPPSAMFSHHQPPPGMAPMPYYRPPPPQTQMPPSQPPAQTSAPQSMSQSTPDISDNQRVCAHHGSCNITLITPPLTLQSVDADASAEPHSGTDQCIARDRAPGNRAIGKLLCISTHIETLI